MMRLPPLVLVAFGCFTLSAAGADDRPSIVLVMADDQGWGDMAYNGHPRLQTPEDLERFKEMAAAQMKAALVQLFILSSPGLVFIYGFFLGILEGAHVVYVVVPSFLIIVLALFVETLRNRPRMVVSRRPERTPHVTEQDLGPGRTPAEQQQARAPGAHARVDTISRSPSRVVRGLMMQNRRAGSPSTEVGVTKACPAASRSSDHRW